MFFQNRWDFMTIWSHLNLHDGFSPFHHILSTNSWWRG